MLKAKVKNIKYKTKHWCHQHNNWHTDMHVNTGHSRGHKRMTCIYENWKCTSLKAGLSNGDDGRQDMRPYWTFRDELVIIDRVAMKQEWIIIPAKLQVHAIDVLYSNHMGKEKTMLLVWESIYWLRLSEGIKCSKKLHNMPWVPVDTAERQK